MRRRMLIIAALLLLGSMINVVVALSCALWMPGGGMVGTVITGAPDASQQWYKSNKPWNLNKNFAGVLEESNPDFAGIGWRQQRLWEPSTDEPQGNMPIGLWRRPKVAFAFRTYSGWPMFCLYGEQWTRYINGGERSETIYKFASALSVERGMVTRDSARIIPLRPIWLGFITNTAIFAGILWLAICGPFVLRRFLRNRRSCCSGCGYPVGTSEVCTECGLSVLGKDSTTV